MKNAKIGAVVGFSLSFVYSLCVVIWQAAMGGSISSALIGILLILLLISFSSAMIGSITSTIFGFILKKVDNNIRGFTSLCLFISLLAVLPFNWAYLNWISSVKYWDGHTLNARNDLFWVIVPPSILYITASGFVSRYLYKINKLNAVNPAS